MCGPKPRMVEQVRKLMVVVDTERAEPLDLVRETWRMALSQLSVTTSRSAVNSSELSLMS